MSTTSNDLTKNYSGIFGNQVLLRNKKGMSVMTIREYKSKKEPSEEQIAVRKRFKAAVSYAKKALEDPETLEMYSLRTRKGQSPYFLAVTDFLNPPYIDSIDVSAYEGKAGDKILVDAGDDFAVKTVEISVFSSAGAVIEKGEAALNPLNSRFEYTATVAIPDLTGLMIAAVAKDYPAHKAELSITL